jgi:hypothetical protein
MARAIDRIENDLAALEEAIALLATEFYNSYSKYLTFLGQAVRQQLILASYQVCTQGYPASFLGLAFSERERLQKALRQLARRTEEQLLSHAESEKNSTETASDSQLEPTPERSLDSEPIQEPTQERSLDSEPIQEPTQEQLPELETMGEPDAPLDAPETAAISKTPKAPLSKPEQLVQWQERLEEAIGQTLQTTSLEANRLLQQAGIIPDKLPAAVLEAASKVDASVETTPGAPNLLNLLMETESDNDPDDSTLTRIIAINLRLSEIEFADPNLSAGRNQIRKLAARVRTLQGEYQKKQRERAVAQAEAAWRSSWFDD